MTRKELLQDEAIVKLAIAMKKQSEDNKVSVDTMIQEAYNTYLWLIELSIALIPVSLDRMKKLIDDNVNDSSEREQLYELIKVLSEKRSSSKGSSAMHLSLMLAAMSVLITE